MNTTDHALKANDVDPDAAGSTPVGVGAANCSIISAAHQSLPPIVLTPL